MVIFVMVNGSFDGGVVGFCGCACGG